MKDLGMYIWGISSQSKPNLIDSRNSHHVKFLRQTVSIAGFDTHTFEKAMNAILNIHTTLGRGVGISDIEACGMISKENGIQLCEVGNRYFSPRYQNANITDEVALSADIDPHGYLAKAALSNGLYHSENNTVAYFEREGTSDGNYRYVLK